MKQFQRHNLDFFVVALALVLSACAMPERSAETALQQVSVSELEEVFTAGYTSITEKYIYSTTVEDVAMDGLRGFGASTRRSTFTAVRASSHSPLTAPTWRANQRRRLTTFADGRR